MAAELQADALLIDERKGRTLAQERGIAVVGTLGIIEKASAMGLLDGESTIKKLQQTTFFASQELIDAALARRKLQG